MEGALLGEFRARPLPDRQRQKVHRFAASLRPTAARSLDTAVERGRILAEAQNFTRDLVNEPANRLTPMVIAEAARTMAAEQGLECEVLDRDAWQNSAWARCSASPRAAPSRRP